MKALAIISITIASLPMVAQDNIDSLFYADVDSVTLNKQVIADEVKYIVDLIDQAFLQWDKKWREKDNRYGTQINHVDVLPGDIIETKGEVGLDGVVHKPHIMFVYEVSPDGKVMIAEQGRGTNIRIRRFDYYNEKDGSKKITIKCFRPR